jgi:ribosomal protein S27AE
MPLPYFRDDARCVKCGGMDVFTRWYPREDYRYPWECKTLAEHQHRFCRRCGYEWDEATTDAPESDVTDHG